MSKIPRVDPVFPDIQGAIDRLQSDPAAFDELAPKLLDAVTRLCKDQGMTETDMLRIFSDTDPNNKLNWYRHFFRK